MTPENETPLKQEQIPEPVAVPEPKHYPAVKDIESLTRLIEQVRVAQRKFENYTQEQVDRIFKAAAMAAASQRIPLSKLAVEETGMGIVEDKVIKNHFASEYIYNKFKDSQTCGVIDNEPEYGIKKIAEPVGVVAGVIPTPASKSPKRPRF